MDGVSVYEAVQSSGDIPPISEAGPSAGGFAVLWSGNQSPSVEKSALYNTWLLIEEQIKNIKTKNGIKFFIFPDIFIVIFYVTEAKLNTLYF